MRTWVEAEASAEATQHWTPAVPRAARDTGKLLATWVLCAGPAIFARSHQYTWSLLLFIAPLALTTYELHRHGALRPLLAPFALSLALLVPMGAVLTIGLADDFFTYPTASATLGLTFPAVDLDGVHHAFQIPIEELLFYVLGFASLLALYAWADTQLFPRVRPLMRRSHVSLPEVLLALSAGVALSAAGWAIQRVANPGAAMPGYWLYLMLVPTPVVIAFGPAMAARLNWPALTVVCLALWGHSILWEVTLAIPQGWWGYQPRSMLGLTVAAWHDLPIEAVLVWLLTPFATVISFEVLRERLTPMHRRTP